MTAYIVFKQISNPMPEKNTEFESQLERLLQKQKNARISNQHHTSVQILKDIITLCFNAQQWQKLSEQITFLMNRRGQSKKAQIEMIQLAMTWLPKMKEPQKSKLIETIRDVCGKKIFLQVEYARCVLMVVKSKQNDNDILEAASILQEVQVETYGSMDKREKLQFILYQMKIMLKKKDQIRFFIISKKINENNINDDSIADIKIQYYAYMASYYTQMKNYEQCCRCYKVIWQTLRNTKKIIPDTIDFGFSVKPNDVLGDYIGFLCLRPYTSEIQAQMKTISENEDIEKYEEYVFLVNNFLSEQIINCDVNFYKPDSFELFRSSFQNSQTHQAELKRMLVQHNIRIISLYYGELSLNRISELINVDRDYCEEELCTLNNRKVVSCRIDRIDGLIDFRPIQNEQFLLKNWNESINSILDLVDVASNLIHREREVYKK